MDESWSCFGPGKGAKGAQKSHGKGAPGSKGDRCLALAPPLHNDGLDDGLDDDHDHDQGDGDGGNDDMCGGIGDGHRVRLSGSKLTSTSNPNKNQAQIQFCSPEKKPHRFAIIIDDL